MKQDLIFSPSFGNRPTHLVGRDNVLQQFNDGLRSPSGSRDRSVLLLGQRGSGKTVLLWEIADRATNQGFVVATPTIASEGMLERIVEKIQDAGEKHLKRRSVTLAGGNLGALGFSAGLEFSKDVQETKSFQYKLTQLVRTLSKQGHGTLILVDELQANSPEVRQLVIAYQELVGEGLDVALIMAGLPGAVSATLNDHVLTFLNRARKVQLEPLRTSDVDAFFSQAFGRLDIHIADDLRKEASIAVQGSPYMLQLVGHNVTAYATDQGSIGPKQLQDALAAAQADFENDICETTLAALSDKDVQFLRVLAKEGKEGRLSSIAESMGVTQDYAQKYRKRLISAGIIESSGWGKVAFAVPYLADYLRKEDW